MNSNIILGLIENLEDRGIYGELVYMGNDVSIKLDDDVVIILYRAKQLKLGYEGLYDTPALDKMNNLVR